MIPPSGLIRKFFQRQLPPAYMGDLDFSCEVDFSNCPTDFSFGFSNGLSGSPISDVASFSVSGGTLRESYPTNRIIGGVSYLGTLGFKWGVQKDVFSGNTGYYSYCLINDYPIFFNNPISGYEANPIDSFYFSQSGSGIEFDIFINGFSPPSIFSNLVGIGNGYFSGSVTQSGLSDYPGEGVPYNAFAIYPQNGELISLQSGIGGFTYVVSGSYVDGQNVQVDFSTHFGNFSRTLIAQSGQNSISTDPEEGLLLNLFGETNLLGPGGQIGFQLDYYSTSEHDVRIELETSQSYSIATLSGYGNGVLVYSGYVNKSGSIFSSLQATGTADLLASENSSFNQQYTLLDTVINIAGSLPSRTTGTYFVGQYTHTTTGWVYGTYDGPFTPLVGKTFSGLGDISYIYTFQESDQGEIVAVDQVGDGVLNPSYSDKFYVDGVPYDTSDSLLFPTGIGYGYFSDTITGRGIVTINQDLSFFGYGTGRIAPSAITKFGTGSGITYYRGNAYRWQGFNDTFAEPPYPPIPMDGFGVGCYSICDDYYSYGKITDGADEFYGSGGPQGLQTWGYPEGPSKIILEGGTGLGAAKRYYVKTDITGYYGTVGSPVVQAIFGYTGYITVYAPIPNIVLNGPVFPDSSDLNMYEYLGDGQNIFAEPGDAYYGRGMIASNWNGDGASGFYLKNFGTLEGTSYISSGGYSAVIKIPIDEMYIQQNLIRPNHYATLLGDEGETVIQSSAVSLTFDNPEIIRTESGQFTGYGNVPTSGINSKFNLYYGEQEEGPFENYLVNGWYDTGKYVRPSDYPFPDDFKTSYINVTYNNTDTTAFDTATLRVSTSGEVREIEINTNVIS